MLKKIRPETCLGILTIIGVLLLATGGVRKAVKMQAVSVKHRLRWLLMPVMEAVSCESEGNDFITIKER